MSLVDKTLTFDCSLNAGSLDHIAELIDNASAKNGMFLSFYIIGDGLDFENKKFLSKVNAINL